jgi:hypothetical protein
MLMNYFPNPSLRIQFEENFLFCCYLIVIFLLSYLIVFVILSHYLIVILSYFYFIVILLLSYCYYYIVVKFLSSRTTCFCYLISLSYCYLILLLFYCYLILILSYLQGLRALYFAISGMVNQFHYLKYGLAIILIFVGIKMVIGSYVNVCLILMYVLY